MSEPEFGAYRSVSVLAIAALLCGLASPLAALAPLCFVFPLAACVLGSIAWARVTRNPEVLTGAGLALTGAALGAMIGAGVIAVQAAENTRVASQGDAFSREWITLLLNDNPSAAFALTAEQAPPAPGAPGAPGAGSDAAQAPSPEESFARTEPAPSLRSLGRGAEIEQSETLDMIRVGHGRIQLGQRLRVSDGQASVSVVLHLERRPNAIGGPAVWRVLSLKREDGQAG
ncbi:hypothetical protein Pla175_01930 [Pirellulimonas nuda]|uniref:DUF4190 domain-containing protein n=1 Tax=Pirellulimonas nuda TaxID=2528009 RepID=A0A518D5U8_9BACT|nr:DUF4190 domain-containing protein [Pirellulimonas nuda]QDU86840.1 hypothetical protein Pla175_01930 [Pirellulimonas nuda]